MADEIRTDPDSFTCPYHGDDLTSKVKYELTHSSTIVTSYSIDFQPLSKDETDEFTVMVTCPARGDQVPAGEKPEAHKQICTGKRVP